MKREFIPIDKIDMDSPAHQMKPDGDFVVNQKVDGKSYQEHVEGIKYLRKLLRDGVKLMPILAERLTNGRFKKQDGFKRVLAHKKEGFPIIEAFVYEQNEKGKKFRYDGKDILCKSGGQSYKRFTKPVEYGEAEHQEKGAGKINWLYYKKGSHVRIEYRENIHVHWGFRGRYRLCLGRRDFDILSEAFINYGKN